MAGKFIPAEQVCAVGILYMHAVVQVHQMPACIHAAHVGSVLRADGKDLCFFIVHNRHNKTPVLFLTVYAEIHLYIMPFDL